MSNEPQTQQPQQGLTIGIDPKQIQQLANLYMQWKWLAPIVGFKIPPELDIIFTNIASGGNPTQEQIQQIQQQLLQAQAPQPQVGEPVLTRHIAKIAWDMHYNDGMSFREIAENLTKDGYPCSHATVCRYIEDIDAQMRFSRISKLMKIGKYSVMVAIWLLSLWLVKTLF